MTTGDNFYDIMVALMKPKSEWYECIDHPTYEEYYMNGK
jgi:hypothetical protein